MKWEQLIDLSNNLAENAGLGRNPLLRHIYA
jgi:hypothetical protein